MFYIVDLLCDKTYLPYFSWYRLFFTAGNINDCLQALQNSVCENISPSRLPLMLEFKPGIKAIQGTKLEMGTVGNYTICYQSVILDKVSLLEN